LLAMLAHLCVVLGLVYLWISLACAFVSCVPALTCLACSCVSCLLGLVSLACSILCLFHAWPRGVACFSLLCERRACSSPCSHISCVPVMLTYLVHARRHARTCQAGAGAIALLLSQLDALNGNKDVFISSTHQKVLKPSTRNVLLQSVTEVSLYALARTKRSLNPPPETLNPKPYHAFDPKGLLFRDQS
jgi:hypothetical protein